MGANQLPLHRVALLFNSIAMRGNANYKRVYYHVYCYSSCVSRYGEKSFPGRICIAFNVRIVYICDAVSTDALWFHLIQFFEFSTSVSLLWSTLELKQDTIQVTTIYVHILPSTCYSFDDSSNHGALTALQFSMQGNIVNYIGDNL